MDNENEADEKEELIGKKVNIFFKEGTSVHVVLKTKQFFNGKITDMSADFFMLNDRVLGEMPIFYMEVFRIEPQEEKRE